MMMLPMMQGVILMVEIVVFQIKIQNIVFFAHAGLISLKVLICNFTNCSSYHKLNLISNFQACWSQSNINNGLCDGITNTPICDYDGGDCCGNNVQNGHCTKCECLNEEQSQYEDTGSIAHYTLVRLTNFLSSEAPLIDLSPFLLILVCH